MLKLQDIIMIQPSHHEFHNFIDKELNNEQKNAVIHTHGPLLVIAGAGSGKTRVITARIASLMIQKNVSPAHIIALTFTNKAAQEMKERILSFLEPNTPVPFVGTFHSYCLQLLKKYRNLVPTQFNAILDAEDQKK